MHGKAPGANGFTLIELLVALTLMALLSVVLFGGLRFGVRAWETGGERVERANRIETVQNLVRRQVSQARLPSQATAARPVAPFVGASNTLEFIAPLPAHRGLGGLYLFHLALREKEGQSYLTLAWRLYRPELLSDYLGAFDEETMLLDNIAGIELSYFGAPVPEQLPQWWNVWDGVNGPPQLVRLRVEFPSGDTRRWPDLIIRVAGSTG